MGGDEEEEEKREFWASGFQGRLGWAREKLLICMLD